jgi:hypothetical protein
MRGQHLGHDFNGAATEIVVAASVPLDNEREVGILLGLPLAAGAAGTWGPVIPSCACIIHSVYRTT